MPIWGLLAATLAGLAVGLERQWSGHASGVNARFGGLRTFTMIGLVSGIAGWWTAVGLLGPATVLLAGIVGIIVVAYVSASRTDIDATTEVSALVVVVAGVLAGIGQTTLSAAITALTVLLLFEKSRLHGLVGRLGEVELMAAARFAVMAVVVLPLLPAEPLGPFGPFGDIRLRQLWALVLFFSGLSFAGFLARRAFGPRRGYAVAGALGGLVSSTSVTLTFSRLSRAHPERGRMLASGVLGANVMLFPRVLVATAVLAPALAWALWPAFLAPVAIGLILLARGIGANHSEAGMEAGGMEAGGMEAGGMEAEALASAGQDRNPLHIAAALQMAVLFQVVLSLVSLAELWFGQAGLYASAGVLGLTDVDALTVSMAEQVSTGTAVQAAAAALVLGILANTVVKTMVALTVGRGRFRTLATLGLAAMAVSLGAWLLLVSQM